MPFRGERSAPLFDQTQPRTIKQYFAQLDALFTRCAITSDLEKKDFATSFITWDIAETWEALPEFSKPTSTFAAFKDRLLDIYNQTTLRYTISDLNELTSSQSQLEIRSLQALTAFHLRFIAISSHLLDLGLLSSREQSQAYLRALGQSLQSAIDLRLQIQYPDQPLSLPHPIDVIFEATRWVLRYPTTPRSILTPSLPSPSILTTMRTLPEESAIQAHSVASPAPNSAFLTSAQLTAILSDIPSTIIKAIDDLNHLRPSSMQDNHSTSAAIKSATISTPVSSPATSCALSTTSAALPTAFTALSTTSTALSTATSPLSTPIAQDSAKARALRIKEIQEEIRSLQAQSKVPTIPMQPTASPKISIATSHPPLTSFHLAHNSEASASNIRQLSSIVNPATFVHHGRVYQAIHWPSRSHIPATAEPPIQSTAPISIPHSSQPDTVIARSSAVSISTSQPLDLTNKASFEFSQPSPPSTASISTQQPPVSPSSTISHFIVAPEVPPKLSLLVNISQAIPSILRPFAHLSHRASLPYIRNHARLKPISCAFAF